MRDKPVVAVCLRHYLPGFKSGGPVRTISNLVEHLGDQIDFRIVTSDRDIHDVQPYPNVARDAWQQVGKARVFYASPPTLTLAGMAKVLNAMEYDTLYLNSFFDSGFTILPLLARRLGMLKQARVVVAPRGELAASALRIRAWKKLPYRVVAAIVGLYAGVDWHASSEFEKADILRRMGKRVAGSIHVAANLPSPRSDVPDDAWQPRPTGHPLRIVFLSRIAPMKNLDYAIRALAAAGVPLRFDIYGMVDDPRYWAGCQQLMAELPPHVRATYHGPVRPEQVGATLAAHDVLLLPTRGENYGHVIAESLALGTPVLISDRTPWRGLRDAGVGWDVPLDESGSAFVAAIEALASMPPDDYAALRLRAARFGRACFGDTDVVEANRRIFRTTHRA